MISSWMIAVVLIQTNMFKHVVFVYKIYLSVFKFQSEFPNVKVNISSSKSFLLYAVSAVFYLLYCYWFLNMLYTLMVTILKKSNEYKNKSPINIIQS